jgi:hypothetical protein
MIRVLLVGGAIVVLVALAFGAVYAERALVPIRDSLTSQRGALRRQLETQGLREPEVRYLADVAAVDRALDASPPNAESP